MIYPAFHAIILPIVLGISVLFPRGDHAVEVPDFRSSIGAIPLPAGFSRRPLSPGSFGAWLRKVPLHRDPIVHLYDGRPKRNQDAQVAVLDIPVGSKDLQQCADACMRLRAEYLLSSGRPQEIAFSDNQGRWYRPGPLDRRENLEQYLEKVFAWCGTASLEKQLRRLSENSPVEPGDVIIQGGFPGHAVMVVDIAENSRGEKRYLLAQSYMPAQQIHILRNPGNPGESPWYSVKPGADITTPEWVFRQARIGRW